jgi:glycosyltransferase involved in cell wall biosynthesis
MALTDRVRVLHVVLDLEAGGLERLVAEMARRTDPRRFETHVLALRFLGRYAKGLEQFARLHEGRSRGGWSMVWPRHLSEQIRDIAPQVVHTHSGVWYKASLAAKRAGVPRLVHTDHGRQHPDPWIARILDGLGARRTDVVVAVSEALAHQLARTVVKGACPIVVVPNGVDTELYRPLPDSGKLRAELGIPSGAPVIGTIGRLDPIKGYDVMIEAFARLLATSGLRRAVSRRSPARSGWRTPSTCWGGGTTCVTCTPRSPCSACRRSARGLRWHCWKR